jgi:hypothetical protein
MTTAQAVIRTLEAVVNQDKTGGGVNETGTAAGTSASSIASELLTKIQQHMQRAEEIQKQLLDAGSGNEHK